MFYVEKIDNKIKRYTNNEKVAKKNYSNYIEVEKEPVYGFDSNLYLSTSEIPSEVLALEEKNKIIEQISALEVQITQRRIREAMLGNKESIAYIEDIEKQIKKLRKKL